MDSGEAHSALTARLRSVLQKEMVVVALIPTSVDIIYREILGYLG